MGRTQAIAHEPDTATLSITPHVVGRRWVLDIHGEIDFGSVAGLAAAVEMALSGGAQELWIDLSKTGFMDSSGLHLLLETRLRTRELNRRLAVISPAGQVRRLFDVAGVAALLPLYDDRAAAHRGA